MKLNLNKLLSELNPYGSYTIAQSRDLVIESIKPITSRTLHTIKVFFVRKDIEYETDKHYTKCPRCLSHHRILENPDGLCNRCRIVIHGS